MEDKYKKLVNLTDRVVKRLSLLEKERSELLANLRKAKEDIAFLKKEQEKYKTLRTWQQQTTALIKQVQAKIAKEIKKIEEQSSKPYLGGKNE
ncbi:MAG: hypothetical protein II972_01640 [Elusimicrobiaceae bacterium]|nr:hypothetical protein [Elusimicrobiaceae bacterium]